MSNLNGAFFDSLKYVIDEDMKSKSKGLKFITDNPDLFPNLTDKELLEFVFGDLQKFVNKFSILKDIK